MVGLAVVSQHTPLAVTVPPPSDVTVPPLAADVVEIELAGVVVSIGNTTEAAVVNVKSEPYDVPNEFVAYALI
jgi:hypothetical protein